MDNPYVPFLDQMDTETRKQYIDGEKAKRLVDSDDWRWAKEKLQTVIDATLSLVSIDESASATAIKNELVLRKRCLAILNSWIEEVEGSANQQQFNLQTINKADDMLVRLKE